MDPSSDPAPAFAKKAPMGGTADRRDVPDRAVMVAVSSPKEPSGEGLLPSTGTDSEAESE
jgi:hypothetical protein